MKHLMLLLLLSVAVAIPWFLSMDYPITHDVTGHIYKMNYISHSLKEHNTVFKWLDNWFLGVPFLYYYPPMSYELVGYFSYFLGLSVKIAIRLWIVLIYFLSAVSMYYLSSLHSKKKGVNLLTAGLYAFATWHTTVINQQGNFPHAFTFPLIPLLFYFFEKGLKKKESVYGALAGTTVGLIVLFHHATTYLLAPILIIFLLLNLKKVSVKQIFYFFIFGALISSFWAIPFIKDIKYSALGKAKIGGINFSELKRGSIKPLLLLFPWAGFNPLSEAGGLNFYISFITVLLATFALRKYKKNLFYILLTLLCLLLTLGVYLPLGPAKESFLKAVSPVQFPFRFLTFACFGLAFLAGRGFEFLFLKNKKVACVVLFLLILDLLPNALVVKWYKQPSYEFIGGGVRIADRTDLFGGNRLDLEQLRGFWEAANPVMSLFGWDLSDKQIEHNVENLYGLARVDYILSQKEEFNLSYTKHGKYYLYKIRPFPPVIGSTDYVCAKADDIRTAYRNCLFSPLQERNITTDLSKKIIVYSEHEGFDCEKEYPNSSFFELNNPKTTNLLSYIKEFPGRIKFTIENPTDAVIMTMTPYYPMWNVFEDGIRKETFSSVSGFLSFNSSEGRHDIEMEYSLHWINYVLLIVFFVGAIILIYLLVNKTSFAISLILLGIMSVLSQVSVWLSIAVLIYLWGYLSSKLRKEKIPESIILFFIIFCFLRNIIWIS